MPTVYNVHSLQFVMPTASLFQLLIIPLHVHKKHAFMNRREKNECFCSSIVSFSVRDIYC